MNIVPVSEAELKCFFSRHIEPVPIGWLYKLGIFFVAIVMMLLPLLYIGLIFFIGYWVLYHLINNTFIFSIEKLFGWRIFIYMGPAVVGIILILFMVKPIFSYFKHEKSGILLRHEDAPLFFTLLDLICDSVKAPKPRAVNVNCDVNASASFRRGLSSFLSHDLTLTIGMPLIAGCSVSQIAGILAHEFGHFSQKVGMRMSYIIRGINYWFFRVVYERDRWDRKLIISSRTPAITYTMIPLLIARLLVWITRRVLWVLMKIGNLISSFLSRHMENHADEYAVKIVGLSVFKSAVLRRDQLDLAAQAGLHELSYAWRERRLVNDFSEYILAKAGQITKARASAQIQSNENVTTSLFDTHSTLKDRLKRSSKEDSNLVSRIDAPAAALFKNPAKLSENATLAFYKATISENISTHNLVSANTLLKDLRKIYAEFKSRNRFYYETLNPIRPLDLSDIIFTKNKCELDFGQLKNELAGKKKLLKEEYENIKAVDDQWAKVFGKKRAIQRKIFFTELRAKIVTSLDFRSDIEKARKKLNEIHSEELKIVEIMTNYEKHMVGRIRLGLLLLKDPRVTARIHNIENLNKRLESVLNIVKILKPLSKIINRINENFLAAEIFYKLYLWEGHPAYDKAKKDLQNECMKDLEELSHVCKNISYPFEHAVSSITLDKFLVAAKPAELNFDETISLMGEVLDRYTELYFRMMGTLSKVAETVESAL